jgi:hypothetical protein
VRTVVLEGLNFVVLGELWIGLDAGRVLDLLPGDRHLHVFAPRGRPGQRDERPLGAQQPGVHARPLGLIGLVGAVQLADRPDLLTVLIGHRAAAPVIRVRHLGHRLTSSLVS